MPGKDKVKLLCDLFSLKSGEARGYVYKRHENTDKWMIPYLLFVFNPPLFLYKYYFIFPFSLF